MPQTKQKAKKESLHEARFSLNVDIISTFEKLKTAHLRPTQDGGRPSLKGDSPLAQIRVVIDKPSIVALISSTYIQIYYKNNQDLPESILLLQPFIIQTETQKPVVNLALKLKYTTLTQTETENLRVSLMVKEIELLIEREKNRILTSIFLSLISDLRGIGDAEMQAKIDLILKRAINLFANLNSD